MEGDLPHILPGLEEAVKMLKGHHLPVEGLRLQPLFLEPLEVFPKTRFCHIACILRDLLQEISDVYHLCLKVAQRQVCQPQAVLHIFFQKLPVPVVGDIHKGQADHRTAWVDPFRLQGQPFQVPDIRIPVDVLRLQEQDLFALVQDSSRFGSPCFHLQFPVFSDLVKGHLLDIFYLLLYAEPVESPQPFQMLPQEFSVFILPQEIIQSVEYLPFHFLRCFL